MFEDDSITSVRSPIWDIEDPLFRAGLIFAGANDAWLSGKSPHESEDGILSAYEISNLDLSNTKLVVLSACETGLGELRGNDGVYGLQRAFRMAGVENIIMSLWKVPDEQTQELMELFYSKWFDGQSLRDAFRSAQFTMAEKYPPFYWAGFVLMGGGSDEIYIATANSVIPLWFAMLAGFLLVLISIGYFLKKENGEKMEHLEK